jgi:hypothetical protein
VAAAWDRVLAQLLAEDAAVAGALTACSLGVDGPGRVCITVPAGRDTAPLRKDLDGARARIDAALATAVPGVVAVLRVEEGAGRQLAYQQAQDHPVVRRLQELFQAELLALEPLDRAGWRRWLGEAGDSGTVHHEP